jgi:hypothetical protein
MDSLKRIELYPDKWYRKMTAKEMENSRRQLLSYTLTDKLDTGIKEVFIKRFFLRKRQF